MKESPTIRIASLNLWGRFGSWEERLEQLRRSWPQIRADVLFVQEACLDERGDQIAELSAAVELPERASFYPHGYSEGVGILSSRPLRGKGAELLPTSGFPRAMVRAQITAPVELELIATHLSFRPHEDNQAQLEAVLTAARKAGGAIVAGGDLNLSAEEIQAAAPDFLHALDGIDASWPVVEMAELERAWRKRIGDGLPPDFDASPRRLDHLLGRGVKSTGNGSVVVPGFDHALVWADFAPRDASGGGEDR